MNRFRAKFGDIDPNTLGTMNNLALIYNKQGKYSDAEALYKQCLDKQKAAVGENDASIFVTMTSLAKCSRQGKHSDAEALYKQCLAKQKKVLGILLRLRIV